MSTSTYQVMTMTTRMMINRYMFNIGFIGSKGISVKVAKELANNKNINVVAVYSRNFENCQIFSKMFGATPYKSYEDFLKDKRINAIYVATPHRYHYHYSKIALEHKIPVICEKTLTLNLRSAEDLYETAKRNNTYFVEAMWTWFNPTAYKVKEWIDNKLIGKVKLFKADFSVPSIYAAKKFRITDLNSGGGSLYDLGIYPVTYAYRLFGYPKTIKATSKMKRDIDFSLKIEFEYENGIKCQLTSAINHLGLCNAKVVGEQGVIKLPFSFHSARKAVLKNKNGKEVYQDREPIKLYEREFVVATSEISEGLIDSRFVPSKATLDVLSILEEIKKQIGLNYPDDMN